MKSRAIFILCTFIILFSINKYSLHKDIKKQNEDISVVNISGKQRMYSQRITKFALVYKNTNPKYLIENTIKIKKNILAFSTAHHNLKQNYLEKYDDFYLSDLYQELEPYFLKIVTNGHLLVNNVKEKSEMNQYIYEIQTNANLFLPIMDNIVHQYEVIGKNRGESILMRELTFNIILAILSIYTVFFLIFPLVNSNKKLAN